jgi:phosphatidylserine decarboxylase
MSANCTIVWIKNFLINYFLKRYAVNMYEAIETNPLAYPSYNAFFTRKLKPECRPIDLNNSSIVSPADGLLAQIGEIQKQKIIQAKGRDYSAQDLLGGDPDLAAEFSNGSFATVYLAPKDYHRVHMPLAGRLEKMIYVPGKLFSVNTHAAENIPNLFARNERVVCIFDSPAGKMAVILVGAMIVGSIATVWGGDITPPHSGNLRIWDYKTTNEEHIELNKGDELGSFRLGSTVIVLFAPGAVAWDENLTINMDVRVGRRIGEILG